MLLGGGAEFGYPDNDRRISFGAAQPRENNMSSLAGPSIIGFWFSKGTQTENASKQLQEVSSFFQSALGVVQFISAF